MSRSRYRPVPPSAPRPNYPGAAPDASNGVPMSVWPVEMVRAVAVAYRTAEGQGLPHLACAAAAMEAYTQQGGDPALAGGDIYRILHAVGQRHGEWLRAPAVRRAAIVERYWRARGIWPPPVDRSTWPPIPNDD